MKKQNLLLIILLSAILFNLAFFYPKYCGWLIIVSLLIPFFILQLRILDLKQAFQFGFLLGLFVFGIHFIWLGDTLFNKLGIGILTVGSIFLFIIIYFSILSSIWCILILLFMQITKRIIGFKKNFINCIYYCLISFCFFYFIQNHSLILLLEEGGYPFINPLIPLAKYKWFQACYKLIIHNKKQNDRNDFLRDIQFRYLKPFNKQLSSISLGQIIYHQLAALNLHKNNAETIIVLAPETFFPFSFNKCNDLLSLWKSVLPENTEFLFGSQRTQKDRQKGDLYYQTVFWLKRDLIIDFYDKTHRVIFAEKIPQICKKLKSVFDFSFKNLYFPFKKGNNSFNKSFKITKNLVVIPKICSEIFFINSINITAINKEKGVIISFVNDSWFLNYFKKIMKQLVIIRSIQLEKPILYVNHQKISIIDI